MHYLRDMLSLDKSVTSQEIYDVLAENGVEAELLARVKDLNTKFEQARFMPGAMTNIKEDYRKLVELLKKLGKV